MRQEKRDGCELTRVGPFLSVSGTINLSEAVSRFSFKRQGRRWKKRRWQRASQARQDVRLLKAQRLLKLRPPRQRGRGGQAPCGQHQRHSQIAGLRGAYIPVYNHDASTSHVGPISTGPQQASLCSVILWPERTLCKYQTFTHRLTYCPEYRIKVDLV